MTVPSFVASIISWFRTGYPEGVAGNGYVPLVALMPADESLGRTRQEAGVRADPGRHEDAGPRDLTS